MASSPTQIENVHDLAEGSGESPPAPKEKKARKAEPPPTHHECGLPLELMEPGALASYISFWATRLNAFRLEDARPGTPKESELYELYSRAVPARGRLTPLSFRGCLRACSILDEMGRMKYPPTTGGSIDLSKHPVN